MNQHPSRLLRYLRIAEKIIWAIILIIKTWQHYGKVIDKDSIGLVNFSISVMALISIILRDNPNSDSYKSEFKHPIGPFKFYLVKTFAIFIAVSVIVFLGYLFYISTKTYLLTLDFNALFIICVIALCVAGFFGNLVGKNVQRIIFNKIDES